MIGKVALLADVSDSNQGKTKEGLTTPVNVCTRAMREGEYDSGNRAGVKAGCQPISPITL